MAGLDRESVYAALTARLQAVARLTGGVSRRLPPSNQAGVPEQPCAFIPAGKETSMNRPEAEPVWKLETVIFVYARTEDMAQAPSSLLTPIVQDIETQLRWQSTDGFARGKGPGTWGTLSKTCEHCEITNVDYAEGILDGQGVAFLHIEILAVAT